MIKKTHKEYADKDYTLQELDSIKNNPITSIVRNDVDVFLYQGDEPQILPEPPYNPPNWLGLEQDLRYSAVFGRRVEVNPIDFNIFTTTLVNGKLGHASENALAFGFSILGLEWTNEDKILINSLLEKNNFVFRLT